MKTILLGAVASFALVGQANAATFDGWYVSLEAGVNLLDDTSVGNDTIDPTFAPGFAPSELSFDTGWAGMLSMGTTWGDFRTELELGFRANDIDVFTVTGTEYNGGGVVEEFSAMANLIYDWRIAEHTSIALGAGVGADQMHYDNDAGFHTVPIHDTNWNFAWQLIAGVNFEISDRSVLFVNYRYFNVEDAEFTEIDSFGDLHNDTLDDVTKHTLTIGWRYDLVQDPQPVADSPPPPPMDTPPPPPKQFVIFFGFGKCNVTAEADAVLSDAAAAAKSSGSASVRIVGHTDSVGSPAANQRLSECRADAAKTNLVGKGVSDSAITTSGKGEGELMVQTGDNVKEPQNRRATVDLQ